MRPDWVLFRSLATLGQKAGVPARLLRRLALKELVDNALDAGGEVSVAEPERDLYVIEDNGPGIPGTPEEIARLFSINRGLVSSKLWRKPQRGALGNGLRVVAGALIASSGGWLVVTTRNRRLTIVPHEDGGAAVTAEPADFPKGTRIEIAFGPHLPADDGALVWANMAIDLAKGGGGYKGKSSAHWFDAAAFYELVHAAGARPVRDLVANLDGCSGDAASAVAGPLLGRSCASVDRAEATALLRRARARAKAPGPERLGAVGRLSEVLPEHYACARGVTKPLGTLEPKAEIPYVVEVWAALSSRTEAGESTIEVCVNRTRTTGTGVRIARSTEKKLGVFGCNLGRHLDVPAKGVWWITLNVTAPYIPITTDGKEPDLYPFIDGIVEALSAALKKAHRKTPGAEVVAGSGVLPKKRRGREREAIEAEYRAQQEAFCALLKKIAAGLDFKVSSRGWGYLLEDRGLGKDEFDACQREVNACRKNGLLPFDFCAEDERRAPAGVEAIHDPDPAKECDRLGEVIRDWHKGYRPYSFWDTVDTYVEMAVEKVDLRELFMRDCAEQHVLISNRGGWADINSRCQMMLRFKEKEAQGKRCVLLYCGDFDPGGLNISGTIMKNFEDLADAVGWDPSNLEIVRFGLNRDFIDEQNLTWIDNLKTGDPKQPPLDDPGHPDHYKDYVQSYLKAHCEIGADGRWQGRKVEANALVTRPEAGRQLCRDALAKVIDRKKLAAYERDMAKRREQLRAKIDTMLRLWGW